MNVNRHVQTVNTFHSLINNGYFSNIISSGSDGRPNLRQARMALPKVVSSGTLSSRAWVEFPQSSCGQRSGKASWIRPVRIVFLLLHQAANCAKVRNCKLTQG